MTQLTDTPHRPGADERPDPLANVGLMVDNCVEIVDDEGRWLMTMPFETALNMRAAAQDHPTAN